MTDFCELDPLCITVTGAPVSPPFGFYNPVPLFPHQATFGGPIAAPQAPPVPRGGGGVVRPRPPPPIAAPAPPPEAIPPAQLEPPAQSPFDTVIAAMVAPFALAPQAASETLAAAEELLSGEQLFESLLGKPYIAKAAPSLFEQLVEQGPVSDFERLLGKSISLSGTSVTAETGGAAADALLPGLLSGVGTAASLLLYSPDLGPSAAEEAALVEETLRTAKQNEPEITTFPLGSDLGLPAVAPIATFEPGQLPEVGVTSTRVPTPVPAPRLRTFPDIALGYQPIPGAQSVTQPEPRTAPRVAPKPAPVPQTLPLTLAGPSPFNPSGLETPRTISSPEAHTAPAPAPKAFPSAQGFQQCEPCQPNQKKKKQKKKERTECYRGTYYELKSGLLKFRKEKIQCR